MYTPKNNLIAFQTKKISNLKLFEYRNKITIVLRHSEKILIH
jgi:hypothetical protein